MSPFTPHPPQQNPRDVAADWLERQEKGALTPEDQARLDQWLDADAAHQDAYAEMERLYALTDAHAADAKIMRLRQAALAARPASRQPIWRGPWRRGLSR